MLETGRTRPIPERIGDFRIVRLLGKGGMGEVYEAEQTSLGRRVAIKLLREDLAADASYLRRFREEAKAAAALQHPNIVSVIVCGEEAGLQYMALEFVDGKNLRDHLRKAGALEERDVVLILRKTAAALQRAHEEGIVHRDIKPENVLLTRKTATRPSEVKVADFGLARRLDLGDASLTQSGVTMGTPLYMSPEQVKGSSVDARSDLYSLGVMAYHLLAGEPPYQGDSPMAVAVQHLAGNPKPLRLARPDLSVELCDLVARLMKVDPAERIASARILVQELNRIKPGQAGRQAGGATTVAATGATGGAAAGTAAIAQSGTRLMLALSQAGRAIADKKRVAWTAPATIVACVALGCAAAWAMRESDLLAQPAAKTERRPPKGDLASLANPKVLLANAHKATDENERERLLWSVFDVAGNNDEQIEPTLEAAVELMSLYLDRGDYERLIEVAKWLHAPGNADDQRTYGLMLHGIVAARRGSWKEARTAFTNALATDDEQKRGKRSGEHFNLEGVRALAHEFIPLVERMPEETGEASRESLKRLFWERFQAPVKRKRP